jgi:3-phenylpropionate/trans-cinnamate dioxygenase ferredoxin reductase subunit
MAICPTSGRHSRRITSRNKAFELLIGPGSFWIDKQIELRLGCNVSAVDLQARVLSLRDGQQIGYGELIWSAEGSPQRVTCLGADLQGVHAVRDKADVDSIMAPLDSGPKRAVVIDGGFDPVKRSSC